MKNAIIIVCLVCSSLNGAESQSSGLLARATAGESEAKALLGFLYINGDGFPQNSAEGLKWLRSAAEDGHSGAQYELGWLYKHFDNASITKDVNESLKWFRKSAEQKYGPALCELALRYWDGDGVPKNKPKSWDFLSRAWKELSKKEFPTTDTEWSDIKNAVLVEFRDNKKWAEWHRRLAEEGYPSAQMRLGWIVQELVGNSAVALEWYQRAAEQSYSPALVEYGGVFQYERGVSEDLEKARSLYKKAAELGYLRASGRLGYMLVKTGATEQEVKQGLLMLQEAAEGGDRGAQELLSVIYNNGERVSKNVQQQLKWSLMAAKQGSLFQQTWLGEFYLYQGGDLKNYTEGISWCKKAAEQHSAQAQVMLGVAYADGNVVEQSYVEAARFFNSASALGDARGHYYLGLMYSWGVGLPRDEEKAKALFQAAKDSTYVGKDAQIEIRLIEEPVLRMTRAKAEAGDVIAQRQMGELYDPFGRGTSMGGFDTSRWGGSVAKSAEWLTKASAAGDSLAQFLLGMGFRGIGLKKDISNAIYWLTKAAEQGDSRAQYNLGDIFSSDEEGAKNLFSAFKWYRLAAEQGSSNAQHNVGFMYYNGNGIEKSHQEAFRWFLKAAEQGFALSQHAVGFAFLQGVGTIKDEVEALAWYGVAAIGGNADSAKTRDLLERSLDRQSVLRARDRSKEILAQVERNVRRSSDDAGVHGPSGKGEGAAPSPKGSGSGAIVSKDGHVLTAFHVIEGATRIVVFTQRGMKQATLIKGDPQNDLAVLKISEWGGTGLTVGRSRGVRFGQAVSTIGFPNIGIQGFSPKVTKGEISSMNGAADDPRSWQISVPVQPGNSGGPLLDENGHLIGVVVSKLGLKAARATGDIPQNVNYAVKISYALPLLEQFLSEESLNQKSETKKLSFEDMISNAQKAVVLILVY